MEGLSGRFVGPEGPANPRYYYVAEAPGEDEDIKGRPLIGKAGRIARYLLGKAGYEIGRIRLHNVVPYRPWSSDGGNGQRKHNRTPNQEEIVKFRDQLFADIQTCKPLLCILAGGVPAKAFGRSESIGSIRGDMMQDARFPGIIFGFTNHPAALIYAGGSADMPDDLLRLRMAQLMLKDLVKFREYVAWK